MSDINGSMFLAAMKTVEATEMERQRSAQVETEKAEQRKKEIEAVAKPVQENFRPLLDALKALPVDQNGASFKSDVQMGQLGKYQFCVQYTEDDKVGYINGYNGVCSRPGFSIRADGKDPNDPAKPLFTVTDTTESYQVPGRRYREHISHHGLTVTQAMEKIAEILPNIIPDRMHAFFSALNSETSKQALTDKRQDVASTASKPALYKPNI